jgi:DNA-binding response OmpR family regulator
MIGWTLVPFLLVEENAKFGSLVTKGFSKAGLDCERVGTIAKGVRAIAAKKYAALIVNRDLPDGDGRRIVAILRARGEPVPIFILARHGDLEDKIATLRAGADDYLVKPFAIEELVVRVQVVLRRVNQLLEVRLIVGNISFDTSTKQFFIEGVPRTLSARELALLELFLLKPEHVIKKDAVEDHIFGRSRKCRSNAIEVYVHRLRKLLTEFGASVQIRTIRNVGYMLTSARFAR